MGLGPVYVSYKAVELYGHRFIFAEFDEFSNGLVAFDVLGAARAGSS